MFWPSFPLRKLKRQYANEESQFLDVGGMDVHFRISGNPQGDTLLLIHGTGASLHTWEDWVSRLKGHFRLIRLDMPGFGLTGPHAQNQYTMDAYTAFLEAFCQRLQLDSFYLAGNSLGGRISWNYALRYPDRVQKLLLLNASGFPSTPRLLVFYLAKRWWGRLALRWVTPKSQVRKDLLRCFVDPSLVTENMVTRYQSLLRREGNRQAMIDRVMAEFDNNYLKLDKIQMPTLIMWGEKDRVVRYQDADKFMQCIPNAKLVSYPDIGHMPMEECPDQSARDALSFLQS